MHDLKGKKYKNRILSKTGVLAARSCQFPGWVGEQGLNKNLFGGGVLQEGGEDPGTSVKFSVRGTAYGQVGGGEGGERNRENFGDRKKIALSQSG